MRGFTEPDDYLLRSSAWDRGKQHKPHGYKVVELSTDSSCLVADYVSFSVFDGKKQRTLFSNDFYRYANK